jgi:hypothetical protein
MKTIGLLTGASTVPENNIDIQASATFSRRSEAPLDAGINMSNPYDVKVLKSRATQHGTQRITLRNRIALVAAWFSPRFKFVVNELADMPKVVPTAQPSLPVSPAFAAKTLIPVPSIKVDMNVPATLLSVSALGKPSVGFKPVVVAPAKPTREESVVAHVEVARPAQPARIGNREKIEKFVAAQGNKGVTVIDIAEHFPEIAYNGIRGRVSELVKQGSIIAVGVQKIEKKSLTVYIAA